MNEENIIHCRETAGVHLKPSGKPWKVGEEVEFMFLPAGVHVIRAGFRNSAIELTVDVDPTEAAEVLQASFKSLVTDAPKQRPFGCFEHDEREASVWPKRFVAKEDGVYLVAEPSALGADHVNGKIHRSWSPSFTTDADYAQAELKDGCWVFPPFARGSTSNPARITGTSFCVGTLTNKPAFRSIEPVRAKRVDGLRRLPFGNSEARSRL